MSLTKRRIIACNCSPGWMMYHYSDGTHTTRQVKTEIKQTIEYNHDYIHYPDVPGSRTDIWPVWPKPNGDPHQY